MIRFLCPHCSSLLESPDHKAGKKVTCPKPGCGQRLQIPAIPAQAVPAARNRTVLGSLVGFLKPRSPKPSAQPAATEVTPDSHPLGPSQPIWFYSKDGKSKVGPVSAAELQALAQADELRPADMVWREGMPKWVPAEKIKGLFTVPAAGSPLPLATVASPSAVLAVAEAEGDGDLADPVSPPPPPGKKSRTGLIIGLSVGGGLLVVAIVLIIVLGGGGNRSISLGGDSAEQSYLGDWVPVKYSSGRFVKIYRDGTALVWEDNEGKYAARFDNGVLKVSTDFGEIAVQYLKSSDHLVFTGREYRRK